MELKDFVGINHFVEKNWGYEAWVANSPLYCGKILCLWKNKKFSWHYHERKDETFFCLAGEGTLYVSEEDCMVDGKFDRSSTTAIHLRPGVAYHIKPLLRHQVVAGDSTLYLMEVSTEHFDWDSIRVEKGD